MIIITAFLIAPDVEYYNPPDTNEPLILIDDIPITIQNSEYASKKPVTPVIVITEEISEPEILDDIAIPNNFANVNQAVENQNIAINENVKLDRKPPRQILEVLPEKKNFNYVGSTLLLKIKIDSRGQVTDHLILFNSLECKDCLSEIISAIYKSIWEPGVKEGIAMEYWVEKSYTFN
ncbi:MAG: hypothetical protein MZV64_73865 [Ignavibacteriales bacterium]|nr:hypothetical protein [Ignavibacteriales bacterium]